MKTAKRIAKSELGLSVKISYLLGTYENLNPYRHDITQCLVVDIKDTQIKLDFQSNDYGFFSVNEPLLKRIIPFQKLMILDYKKKEEDLTQ